MPVVDVAVAVESVVAAVEGVSAVRAAAFGAWVVVGGRLFAVVGYIVEEVGANVSAGTLEDDIGVDFVPAPLGLW